MRTLFVSSVFFASAISGFAGDNAGPKLLDDVALRPTRAASPTTGNASIRVDVNMALVPVTVLDTLGHNVVGLTPENFRVFEGTEQRPIVSFGRTDAPVSVGIIFDCSRSMRDKFQTSRLAPAELFKQLNPEDEAFLVTVADKPQLVQDFTSNFSDIQNALLFVNPNGTTSLVDGIYLGLQHLKKSHNQRRALIVISDGGDNNSRYTLSELTAMAAEADTQIFSLCIFQNPKTPEEMEGPLLLGKLSLVSGGLKYMTSDINDLRTAFGQVGVTLHNQYVLGYYPPDHAPAGKYRKIKVQLLVPSGLPRMQIFARAGYYMPDR